MNEYIWGILNPPDDNLLIATFLVNPSGPAFHKMKKKTSNSLISSASGFGNDRNNDTNLDNASDFMIVIRPKRVSFRFDHCLTLI